MDKTSFLEDLILMRNPKLRKEDLDMLFTLSKEYDVIGVTYEVFDESIETILSWLIINKLPYVIGSKCVLKTGKLLDKLVFFDKDGRLHNAVKALTYEEYITFHVERMNKLLYES